MYTRLEMETIVNYNDEEAHAEVYTASKQVMRKLDKLCARFPDTYRCVKRNEYQATYHCPKNLVSFRAPHPKQDLTEEQREERRRRAKAFLHRDA